MGRKGWWQQLQSGDMPKTKTNYGDFRALDDRPSKPRKTVPLKTHLRKDHNISQHQITNLRKISSKDTSEQTISSYFIRCVQCGNEKIITTYYLKALKTKYSISASIKNIKGVKENLERFKCNKCGSKNVKLKYRK